MATQGTPATNGKAATIPPVELKQDAPKQDVTPVTSEKSEDTITVSLHEDITKLVYKLFDSQDDIENESKFQRAFIRAAAIQQAKTFCTRTIALWDRAVDKVSKSRPQLTREQVVAEMLVSKRAKKLFDASKIAAEVKKQIPSE